MKGLEQRPAISPVQLVMFQFGVFVGVGFIYMPRGVIEKAREDAWVTVILAGICALVSLWMINRIARTFPNDTVIEYNRKIFGNFIGNMLNIVLGLYYLSFSITGIRIMAEVVSAEMLPFTPIEAIIAAMLLVIIYSGWNGLMPIIRIFESGLPITFILMILFFLSAFPRADWTQLQIPFQKGVLPILSALPQTIYSFLGYEVLLLYYPFLTRKENSFTSGAIAIVAGAMFYAFLVLGMLVTLGPDVSITQTYPVVDMTKTIEVVRQFVERAELLLIMLWLPLAYTTHLGFFFSSAFTFHRTFPRLAMRWWMVLLLPIVYILSLIPDNLIDMLKWSDLVGGAGLFFTVPYPLILFICILLSRKKGNLPSARKKGELT